MPDVVTMHPKPRGDLAVMLTGGGARAAYQVGLLRGIAHHFPNLDFRIVTGVSAGAINAIFLAAQAEITVEHVLASSALPFVFPAVRIGERWYGDGGIRLAAPLSPAVHLGASRILAMSTGYQRTPDEAEVPVVTGYPPTAQLLGQLVNAIFLDVIDEDVARMQ